MVDEPCDRAAGAAVDAVWCLVAGPVMCAVTGNRQLVVVAALRILQVELVEIEEVRKARLMAFLATAASFHRVDDFAEVPIDEGSLLDGDRTADSPSFFLSHEDLKRDLSPLLYDAVTAARAAGALVVALEDSDQVFDDDSSVLSVGESTRAEILDTLAFVPIGAAFLGAAAADDKVRIERGDIFPEFQLGQELKVYGGARGVIDLVNEINGRAWQLLELLNERLEV